MNNSNITINYQIGVPEGTGVDTSDAIKKLNTETKLQDQIGQN